MGKNNTHSGPRLEDPHPTPRRPTRALPSDELGLNTLTSNDPPLQLQTLRRHNRFTEVSGSWTSQSGDEEGNR